MAMLFVYCERLAIGIADKESTHLLKRGTQRMYSAAL